MEIDKMGVLGNREAKIWDILSKHGIPLDTRSTDSLSAIFSLTAVSLRSTPPRGRPFLAGAAQRFSKSRRW